ncbi:MAG: UvrD-helicase domain-containing protein [Candidatus Cloacimonadaceae bacterium]|jgi:ATP-dependent exoDNAse (exonuclease V) beta subunit|nr:UvrD-helicase domain-containing protein [Candidatus Cloacimonadota bacterium]MDY0127198.1 UvrD-helicase domain-containing protein [Candidatus Cloacimonadaceae bacterium]MCB5255141.1 UvrD-helicase domain-containing protein [Candidatus Cloacimonadota bacterium]MCK9178740.1 UvrD-helicase domain-containing protein [Candidatus Cloacimonadota bacterium]MCK9241700.1 UvrD-helicase domain-containing protein [Candidatus Cloacimonadota bacterium]
MTDFQNRIISASAGTGKTYRLSIEYISLILRYYRQHPEFSLDCVLALTFTRKATAEIRERIMSQLQELLDEPQGSLALDLRRQVAGDPEGLSIDEQGILRSALLEISADQRNLQVMTIDSFTSSIFRNIVRPLRSIDSYELDQDAVNKRLPYLMNHLMNPAFRDRVDKLLSRKVRRSLDDYSEFFKSLIYNRWIYFLIKRRCPENRYAALPREHDFEQAFRLFIQSLYDIYQDKAKGEFAKYFKTDFRSLLPGDFENPPQLSRMVEELLQRSSDAMALLKVIDSKGIFSRTPVPKDRRDEIQAMQDELLSALAEKLYHEYFIPEQEEILQLWEIILREYDQLIYRYKNMTYQDIAWFTFEALFSPEPPIFDLTNESAATEFYEFLSHRTRFMLIDEFQDTSLIQFNTLRPIMEEICSGYGSKEIGGIIVVGDEKQSIFGWRGGERDLLLNLKHIIPSLSEVEIEPLMHSWRAGGDMMNFINHIFCDAQLHGYLSENGMSWQYPQVKSAIDDLSTTIELKCMPHYHTMGGKSETYNFFVEQMILPALQDKQGQESVAILCRKTRQLEELQLLLEEHGQSGIFQPSAPITTHHLVAALMHWLSFVSYGDWLDFLAFVRSDFLLLDSAALKDLIDLIAEFESGKQENPETLGPKLSALSPLDELLILAGKQAHSSPYNALLETISLCLRDHEAFPERDYLNLQVFLNIAKDWELSIAKAGLSIPAFLAYVKENTVQDGFTQVSVEGDEGIQLITIHKSKGLQFDRVFVLYDLSRPRSSQQSLYWAIQYMNQGFQQLSGYALSYHYEEVLKHSPAAQLWQDKNKASLLEELNTLYVAFTRAKKHLHILFTYSGTKDWSDYYAQKQGEDTLMLPAILANACLGYFGENEPDEQGIYRFESQHDPPQEPESDPDARAEDFRPELSFAQPAELDWSAIQSIDALPMASYKEVYLEKRQALWGDLAHYYLFFIKTDSPDEHERARRECISRYGSLLPVAQLKRFFSKLCLEIRKHGYLFDPDYDRIYNEFEVGDSRVDRLMLNTAAKKAWIIDYKTGDIHEQEQLDVYQKALSALPAFQGYSFQKDYVLLDLRS